MIFPTPDDIVVVNNNKLCNPHKHFVYKYHLRTVCYSG
jgi:hypothetical protein